MLCVVVWWGGVLSFGEGVFIDALSTINCRLRVFFSDLAMSIRPSICVY